MKIQKKKKPAHSTENLTIRIPKEMHNMLSALAKEFGVSRQKIINNILDKSIRSKDFSIEL